MLDLYKMSRFQSTVSLWRYRHCSDAGRRSSLSFMLETSLYPAVKRFLEAASFDVKSFFPIGKGEPRSGHGANVGSNGLMA